MYLFANNIKAQTSMDISECNNIHQPNVVYVATAHDQLALCDVYMRHWTRQASFQVMACRLFVISVSYRGPESWSHARMATEPEWRTDLIVHCTWPTLWQMNPLLWTWEIRPRFRAWITIWVMNVTSWSSMLSIIQLSRHQSLVKYILISFCTFFKRP